MKRMLVLLLLLLQISSFADAAAAMVYPVEEIEVSSPFGWRIHPITGAARFHSGTDFAYDYGRVVHAAASGIVTYSGWISGYGNTVMISHGGSLETLYGHNQECLVFEGQQVAQGQPIALCGSTGNSTGPHCHFEVRENGEPVDPAGYLSGLPPASGGAYGLNMDFDTVPLTFDAYYDFAKPVRETVDAFGKACTNGLGLIKDYLKWLFFVLLTIDLALSAMKQVSGGIPADGNTFAKWLLLKLLFYGFLTFMFLHWGDLIVNTIRSYFGTMGAYGMGSTEEEAGKLIADPTEIVQLGAHYVSPILTYMGSFSGFSVISHLPILLLCTITSAAILLCFFLIGVEFALTYIEFYVTALFGFVSFSFVGFSHTRKYAANAINGVFVCGLKLMVFIVVALVLSSALKDSVPEDYFDIKTVSMSANGGNFASVEEFASAIKHVESSGNYTVYNSEGSGAYGAYQQMPEFWDGRCEAYENDHPNEHLCRADTDNPPNAPSTYYSWCPENQDRVSKYQMQCLYEEGGHSWRYVAARWLGTDSEEYWQKVCNGGGNRVEKTISIIVLLKLLLVSLAALIFGHADGKTILKEFGSSRFRFRHAG